MCFDLPRHYFNIFRFRLALILNLFLFYAYECFVCICISLFMSHNLLRPEEDFISLGTGVTELALTGAMWVLGIKPWFSRRAVDDLNLAALYLLSTKIDPHIFDDFSEWRSSPFLAFPQSFCVSTLVSNCFEREQIRNLVIVFIRSCFAVTTLFSSYAIGLIILLKKF